MRFGLIVQVTGPLGDPRPLVRAFIQSQRPATEPFDVMAGGTCRSTIRQRPVRLLRNTPRPA
jgi:hypothetical protein